MGRQLGGKHMFSPLLIGQAVEERRTETEQKERECGPTTSLWLVNCWREKRVDRTERKRVWADKKLETTCFLRFSLVSFRREKREEKTERKRECGPTPLVPRWKGSPINTFLSQWVGLKKNIGCFKTRCFKTCFFCFFYKQKKHVFLITFFHYNEIL